MHVLYDVETTYVAMVAYSWAILLSFLNDRNPSGLDSLKCFSLIILLL